MYGALPRDYHVAHVVTNAQMLAERDFSGKLQNAPKLAVVQRAEDLQRELPPRSLSKLFVHNFILRKRVNWNKKTPSCSTGRAASTICASDHRHHRRRCNKYSSRKRRPPTTTATACMWRETIWKNWYERNGRDYKSPRYIRSPHKSRPKQTNSPNRPTRIKLIWRIIVIKYALYMIYRVIKHRMLPGAGQLSE